VDSIASAWGNRMQAIWTDMMRYHPDTVIEATSGHLTAVTFAVARNGSIECQLILIALVDNKPTITHPPSDVDCIRWPCAAGLTEIAMKYITDPAEFMTAHPATIELWGYELLRCIRLVDLTIAFDKSKSIGGRIDALDISNDGRIQWHAKKDNCRKAKIEETATHLCTEA
jgi:hypothetical protein